MPDKVLFWDFDGTLAYSNYLWSGSILRVLRRLSPGYPLSLAQVRPVMRTGFTWHTPDEDYSTLLGDAWWAHMTRRFREVYRELGVPPEVGERAAALVREEILNPAHYQLYDDAEATLTLAMERGWRNYLLSNNYPELEAVARQLGLGDYFDGYVVSALVGYDKPRREIFDHALALAGRPAHRLMVGDNPEADVRGAAGVSMDAALVHTPAPEGCLCRYNFARLSEMSAIL